jgi:hypothetical protein
VNRGYPVHQHRCLEQARNKQALVESIAPAVSDDGIVTASEAELLRCARIMLRCPIPPPVA